MEDTPATGPEPVRVGVMGSTRGSSLQPVIDAIREGTLRGCEIVVVVSNIKRSGILERARAHGIPDVHITGKNKTREAFDTEATEALRAYNVEVVLLVGFMRIFSPQFVREWQGKVLNVHPSLLPDFAGGMDLAVHQVGRERVRSLVLPPPRVPTPR